ncbi:hypothetical protein ATANTOWER_016554, partial [Ataeniobius toweri]|nr:hypothetical protein [Ataeniobius toweri]
CLCTATADRHNKLQLQLIQTGNAGDHHFLRITVSKSAGAVSHYSSVVARPGFNARFFPSPGLLGQSQPELAFYLENSHLPVRPLPALPPLKEDLKHNGHTVSLPTSGPVTYMASIPTR